MATDGRRVWCDGEECRAFTTQPVGLRNDLAGLKFVDSSSPRGWLFVNDRGGARHFCPCCAVLYLREHERAEA